MMAFLITALALQMGYPFALVFRERRKTKHSYIDGRQLVFTGSAWRLFGNWIKWLLLTIVTLGVYVLWVGPQVQKWKWEHTTLAAPDHSSAPHPSPAPAEGITRQTASDAFRDAA